MANVCSGVEPDTMDVCINAPFIALIKIACPLKSIGTNLFVLKLRLAG
jgi:hypothetical protein